MAQTLLPSCKLFVLGDTTYSGCCVDEVSAEVREVCNCTMILVEVCVCRDAGSLTGCAHSLPRTARVV